MGTTFLAAVTDAFGAYGGIAQYNRDFLTAAATHPAIDRVEIFPRLAPEPPVTIPQGLTVHRPSHNKLIYGLRTAVAAAIGRPGLVYNGHIYHGPLSAKLEQLSGGRMISQLHGTEVWQPLAPPVLSALDRSALVLCVSEDTRRRYRAQSQRRDDNTHIVPNTVGPHFSPAPREGAREKFGLGDRTTLLTVARLDPREEGYKGHGRVLRALPGLLDADPSTLYLIAGVGPDRARLETLVSEMGLTPHVRFLGKVPFGDLADLYRAADLFVMPSTGEGFGIVFLEAMAAGTPALGLAVGGAPDALDGLGEAVSEDAFAGHLPKAVATARGMSTDARKDLAKRTQERFGFAAFSARVHEALDRVL
ncbi:hypothetical protein PB2503_11334 [Parvularcula bermudensis HTCC2503]|uniref:Glycosyl transferase family 1 domain-containing protein n=1 Tax=Parvularcula bermudensis (strain ATCC BAA-594 / HTCC2503 / KCTC 12087) TaxID=314260 RepID=E0TC56_PARBH|nr:glycosyltransferase family 4 protein [Parvularcula bermudensis]ADM10314.1 hypothetical protein PB2503_11334 [Parvularcula bermudensis HTCC2503]